MIQNKQKNQYFFSDLKILQFPIMDNLRSIAKPIQSTLKPGEKWSIAKGPGFEATKSEKIFQKVWESSQVAINRCIPTLFEGFGKIRKLDGMAASVTLPIKELKLADISKAFFNLDTFNKIW